MSDHHSPAPRRAGLWNALQEIWQRFLSGVLDLQLTSHHLYQTIERPLRWFEDLLILGGLGTVVAEYGFQVTPVVLRRIHTWQAYVVWGYLTIFLLRLALMPNRWNFLRRRKLLVFLLVLLGLDFFVFQTPLGRHWLGMTFHVVDIKRIAVLYISFIQGFILLIAFFEGTYLSRTMATWQIRPAQTLVLSFLALIVLGTLLFMLPKSTTQPGSLSFLDAWFTATSAVCVTGLIVVDTATYFTPLGQGILIGLCQLGGLGIITFATVIGMMMRGNIGIRERVFFQDLVASQHFGEISTTVRHIVGFTLLIEALGAVSLYYNLQGIVPDTWTRVGYAIFHAISAFCNAGFSTFSSSLASPEIAMHTGVNVTVTLLIILGGLGFVVLWEGVTCFRGDGAPPRRRFSVQSRLVGITTGLLIIVGAGLFAMLEWHGVLAGHTWGERVLGALFQAVTARTAGFNTLPIEELTVPAVELLILLMVIGASPGSTGGGMKTTTVAVLFLTTLATLRGKARVEAFRRTLPWTVINQAYATFFFSIAVMTLSFFILTVTEAHSFLDLFFEEVSAFATVGLSRGITSSLSAAGKVVIIMSMFVGRVGSLTFGVALAHQVSTTAYEYPTEAVMVS